MKTRKQISNQVMFIGLVSSKNYRRWPRLLQTWQKGVIRQSGTSSWGNIEGRVRGALQGTGTAIVHPVAVWISLPTKLAIYSGAGLLERCTHVGGDGSYAAVGETWKYGREAYSGWGQQRLCRMGRPCITLYIQATTDSSTDKGKKPQPLESWLIWDVVQHFKKFHRGFLSAF